MKGLVKDKNGRSKEIVVSILYGEQKLTAAKILSGFGNDVDWRGTRQGRGVIGPAFSPSSQ